MSSAEEVDLLDDVASWLREQPPLSEPLAEAVAIESYPATLQQNDVIDVVDAVVGRASGIELDRWVPDWSAVERFSAPDDDQLLWSPLGFRDERYADVLPRLEVAVHAAGTIGSGRTVMLNGHSDVVPVVRDDWSTDPFRARVEDGRMIGRGVMDMKAGLIASAYAFRYLAERRNGPGRVLLATVPEEETGGDGTLAALQRGWIPDVAVFAEPTDLSVVHRHIGIQGYDVTITGREGGMLRKSWADGVAPALAGAGVALARLEERRTVRAFASGGYEADDLPGFINFTIHAGDWPATRAGSGSLRGLMGLLPGETQEEALDELRSAAVAGVRSVAGESATRLEVTAAAWPGGHRGTELAADHPLVAAFTAPSRVGAPAPVRATTSGTMVCDAKIMQGGGWAPSIAFGPVGGGLHAADEWVDLASVGKLVGLLVRGVSRYLDAE